MIETLRACISEEIMEQSARLNGHGYARAYKDAIQDVLGMPELQVLLADKERLDWIDGLLVTEKWNGWFVDSAGAEMGNSAEFLPSIREAIDRAMEAAHHEAREGCRVNPGGTETGLRRGRPYLSVNAR